MFTSDIGIDRQLLVFLIHFRAHCNRDESFLVRKISKNYIFKHISKILNIFRMCAMICLALSDPTSKPSMYDLCRRKYWIQTFKF